MSRFFKIKEGYVMRVSDHKVLFIGIMILSFIISIGALAVRGVNYGIDFKGGLSVEAQVPDNTNLEDMRSKLNDAHIGAFSLQEFGNKNTVLIKMELKGNDKEGSEIVNKMKIALGNDIVYRNIENVGPKVGNDLKNDSILAVIFALIAILIYIWFRFDWQFGVCGVIALIHDCVALMGFYAIFHNFDFNIASVCAILMTAGYSINDTVVIFDRINENIRAGKGRILSNLIDVSITETLTRTVLTSFTTLLALACLCIFGRDVIFAYAFPMFIGISVGTFSSIFISAPLLMYTNYKIPTKQEI